MVAVRARDAGHDVTGTFLTRRPSLPGVRLEPLDVRDPAAVASLVARARPDVVLHTAYRLDDWGTTAGGAALVALAAVDAGARLVHVSSDVVFSGDRASYTEDDVPDAVSAYGRAKVAAEHAVLACAPGAAVVRTSLILGHSLGRPSPMESLVHGLVDGSRGGALFTDDVKCPVHVDDLADALLEVATTGLSGVLHCAGPQALSRDEIGLLIAARDGLETARLPRTTRAAAGVGGAARLVLDGTRTRGRLATRLRGAREFLG